MGLGAASTTYAIPEGLRLRRKHFLLWDKWLGRGSRSTYPKPLEVGSDWKQVDQDPEKVYIGMLQRFVLEAESGDYRVGPPMLCLCRNGMGLIDLKRRRRKEPVPNLEEEPLSSTRTRRFGRGDLGRSQDHLAQMI